MALSAGTAGALLAEAERRRSSGRYSVAVALYQQVLAEDPSNEQALHGIGSAFFSQEDYRQAVPFLEKVVTLRPRAPATLLLYGESLRQLGELPRATEIFLRAVNVAPSVVAAAVSLVDCLLQLGQAEDAERAARYALSQGADPVLVSLALARALLAQDKLNEAEAVYSSLLSASPTPSSAMQAHLYQARARVRKDQQKLVAALSDSQAALDLLAEDNASGAARVGALLVQATILRAQEAYAAAELICRQALEISPQSVDGLASLATVLDLQKRHSEAETLFLQVLAQAPQRDDIAYNLAACLMAQDRPREAEALYRQCLSRTPNWTDAACNLGVSLLAQNRAADAEQAFTHAVSAAPDNAEARYNLAWAQLIQGDFANGWVSYEARWDLPTFSSPHRGFPLPLWDGKDDPQAVILLHAEQGLGDAIQFMRLVALVKPKVRRVILEVPLALFRLAESLVGLDPDRDEVVIADYDAPHDLPFCLGDAPTVQAPLMSLPRLLGLTLEQVATLPTPFLTAPLVEPAFCLPPLPPRFRQRVGLVWAGAASNKIDRFRTISFPTLQPLLYHASGYEFWSLQMGDRAAEGKKVNGEFLPSKMGEVRDLADTAALIAQLDLVIGVDTAVLHLAAALGKPCWMLLPFAPDYRWLLERAESPWYPTLRLFRQPSAGDWRAVVAEVKNALVRRMEGTAL